MPKVSLLSAPAAVLAFVAAFLLPVPERDSGSSCLACGLVGASGLQGQDLDQRVATALAGSPATGAVLAVVHADSLLLLKAFGHADQEGLREMSISNLFPLGSAGEILLGALAVRMARAGVVSLGSPAARYAPDLPDGIGRASLAQFLLHTAGLDDSPLLPRRPEEEPQPLPPERELELLSDRVLLGRPGVVRSYSRFSLNVAGHILERAGGQPLAHLIRTLIAAPAGMRRIAFSTEEALALGTATGYTIVGQGPDRSAVPAPLPVDSLRTPHLRVWTSALDLANLMSTWLRNLPLGDQAPEVAVALRLSAQPMQPNPESSFERAVLGIGWRIHEFQGRRELRATGGSPGHTVLLRVLPEQQLAVVVMENGSGSGLFPVSTFILERLLPTLGPGPPGPPTPATPDPDLLPLFQSPSLEAVEKLGPEHAGAYRNGSEILVLVEREGGLVADLGTAEPLEIRPQGHGFFSFHISDGREGMRVRMVRDPEGRAYLVLRGRAFPKEEP
jgi:CubicO group peptidase (beta-lactamase class C family)